VVVHEAHRLHERVDRRRADEAEAAPPEIAGQRARRRALGEPAQRGARHAPGSLALRRLEAPDVGGERAELALQRRHRPRVAEGRLDLPAVPDDAGVAEQPGHVARSHARHGVDLEIPEGAPEVRPLAEDREPGEAGLEALEAELLEEPAIVGDREAPLLVVVGAVERVAAAPAAARDAVLSARDAGREPGGHGARV
jgi:hypothetical protein